MAPLCVPGPSTGIVSLKPRQCQCVPRAGETRPEGEGDSTRAALPGHAGTCRDLALPGTSPAQALPLTSRNPGLASAVSPPGRLCVGPVRRLELPMTYFSGQEEPFGVRGLSFGARTIKIKTARTPGQPGPGKQQPQRGAADGLERKQGGRRRWEGPDWALLCSLTFLWVISRPSTSHFIAADIRLQSDRMTCWGHKAGGPRQLGLEVSASVNNSSYLFSIYYVSQIYSCDIFTPHLGGVLMIHFTGKKLP